MVRYAYVNGLKYIYYGNKMEMSSSNLGNGQAEPSQISGKILSTWLERAGVDRRIILQEIERDNPQHDLIGMKSFVQWTSEGKSARLVSGSSVEVKGERLVALVNWFIKEHMHRLTPVVSSLELRDLMAQYSDLPVMFRLQLRRLSHDLEVYNGERQPNFSFATDWKSHFSQWPVFCFVIDAYWCVRASTSYEMSLAGYVEEDMTSWGWWHRLTASKLGKPKFNPDSNRYSLRGSYSEEYYSMQMSQFLSDTKHLREAKDERYLTLLDLLKSSNRFLEFYQTNIEKAHPVHNSYGLPIPFFRQDGTLLWMLEVNSVIPNTENFRLIAWIPLTQDSAEYQGELQYKVDTGKVYSQKAYFIEDFAQNFSASQRFAFGLD